MGYIARRSATPHIINILYFSQASAKMMLASKISSRSAVRVGATKKSGTATTRVGGAGYRKYDGDALWLPNTTRPEWLDGEFGSLFCSNGTSPQLLPRACSCV